MSEEQTHQPHRDDEVATWLKYHRDAAHPPHGEGWNTLDLMLDEYRLAADTGQSLEEVIQIKDEHGEPVDLSIPDEWKGQPIRLEPTEPGLPPADRDNRDGYR